MLAAVQKGDPRAAEELLPLVYGELRKLAASRMAREVPGQTLQPTALVHEAWLRISDGADAAFEGRAHFFAAAAEAMRRIMIERARRKNAAKRGAGAERLDIEEIELAAPCADEQLLAVDEALDRFSERHPTAGKLLKLRYFTGLTLKEAAAVMGVSPDTAKDYCAFGRAWLYKELSRGKPTAGL